MAMRRAKCSECGNHFEFDPEADDRVVCPHCAATLATPGASRVDKADPLLGQMLGQFEIVEVLGRGGMGAVYKARQTSLDRFVALKILPRAFARDASFVERFAREGRAAAAVKHPHIIGVYGVGQEGGLHFIAMELVQGQSLGDVLKQAGPLSAERAIDLLRQVASALGEAHDAGIHHRDIKPSNILLDHRGNAKVADFGLAKRQGMDVSVTQTGQALGTPLYMPPEAARGQPLDARSDLYSLGATFYQALAGRPPFQGSSAAELVGKHLEAKVPPLQQVAPDTPPALCRIIHRLLRKQPAQRYESAHQLLAALERLEGRLTAEPDDVTRTLPSAPRPATQHREPEARKRPIALIAGIGGGALLLLLLLLLLLSPGGNRPPKAVKPPPPSKAPAQPNPDADEKNAAIVLNNARTCAAKGEWDKVEIYLGRLKTKYSETQLYAASLAAVADLRKQAAAALRPEPGAPIAGPTVSLRRALMRKTNGAAALSPDGTRLAWMGPSQSGGYFVAPVEDLDKSEWIKIRKNSTLKCLAWGRDEPTLAASGDYYCVTVWGGSSILNYHYSGQKSTVHSIAFSPDATVLAAGASDKSVWLWDIKSVKTIWKRQSFGCHETLVFTPDGRMLACGGYPDKVHLCDAATGETLRELSGHTGTIRNLAISPDGTTLAGASEDNTIRLWDIKTGALRRTLTGHTDQVWAVAFSRDGALLASGSNDTTVRLWDARAGRPLTTATGHTAAVCTVGFSSANVLVTVGQESIRVWDLLPPGAKPEPPKPTTPLPPPAADGWSRLLDGTSLKGWEVVKDFPGTDAAGPVEVKDGSVVLGTGWPWTGMVWKGDAPSVDYELEIEGQRVKGLGDFCSVVFPVKGESCKINVGGHWPTVVALDTVDGRTGRDGGSPARRPVAFKDGQWYRVRVRVTAERIEAWLDDEQVINLPLARHKLTLFDNYPSMAALKPLGVCSWKTKGAIRGLRLRRLKPDGTPVVPPKPPKPEPPAPEPPKLPEPNYATRSEWVWGLLAQRKYADAEALLAKLAADPRLKDDAGLAADRQAAELLAEFWGVVEKKLAQMKGRFTRVGEAAGQVVSVADGVVTLKTAKGLVRSPVRDLTAKQAVGFASLGDDPRAKLLLGVFLVAEGEDPKEADAALAAAGDDASIAHYRKRLAPALQRLAEAKPPAVPEPAPKTPEPKPSRPAWRPLFNGKDLTGWKGGIQGWRAERGLLTWAKKASDIWTEKQFGDFALDLEFRLAKGANSGVFIRVGDPQDDVHTGLEVQIMDRVGNAKLAKNDCGAIYGLAAPRVEAVKRPGEWNRMGIAAKGSRIQVVLNGTRVVDMDLDRWTQQGRNPDGTGNKLRHAGKDMPRVGHIAIQNYGTDVTFRNLRIRPLGD